MTLHVVVLEKKISTLIKDSYRNISDMSGDFTCSSSTGTFLTCLVTLHVVVLEKKISTLIRTPTGTFLTCLVTLHVVVLEKKISTLIKDSYRNISDMSGDFTCSSSGEEDFNTY